MPGMQFRYGLWLAYGQTARSRDRNLENHFPVEFSFLSVYKLNAMGYHLFDGGLLSENCQLIVPNDWLTRPHVPFNQIYVSHRITQLY